MMLLEMQTKNYCTNFHYIRIHHLELGQLIATEKSLDYSELPIINSSTQPLIPLIFGEFVPYCE